MGYIRHHAIVVTASIKANAQKAYEKAIELFPKTTTNIVEDQVNGYCSFLIAPDGSKEGWSESLEGDINRGLFIDYLNEFAYEDGSNNVRYCEFFYGDDNRHAKIENHN